jgi:hypothetical protein
VIDQCKVSFKIGDKDGILCDVILMDTCYLLLGRLLQFDKGAMHDGRNNTYTIMKDGRKV